MQQSNIFPKAFAHYKPRSLKVYGVICISRDNRLLLVKGKRTGIWSFPKGHLKGNETSQQCALRELEEETGIVLKPETFYLTRKLFAGEYFFYQVDDEFPVEPKDTFEVSDGGWFSLEELPRLHCNADIVNLINRLHKGTLVFNRNQNKIDLQPRERTLTNISEQDVIEQVCV